MTNHVACSLRIGGPRKDRDAFMKTVGKYGFDFKQTVSKPGHTSSDGFYPNSWCMDNWGTIGEFNTSRTENGPHYINVTFKTIKFPPVKWLENVSKKFPSLKFTLAYKIEGGPGQCQYVSEGRYVAENGRIAKVA